MSTFARGDPQQPLATTPVALTTPRTPGAQRPGRKRHIVGLLFDDEGCDNAGKAIDLAISRRTSSRELKEEAFDSVEKAFDTMSLASTKFDSEAPCSGRSSLNSAQWQSASRSPSLVLPEGASILSRAETPWSAEPRFSGCRVLPDGAIAQLEEMPVSPEPMTTSRRPSKSRYSTVSRPDSRYSTISRPDLRHSTVKPEEILPEDRPFSPRLPAQRRSFSRKSTVARLRQRADDHLDAKEDERELNKLLLSANRNSTAFSGGPRPFDAKRTWSKALNAAAVLARFSHLKNVMGIDEANPETFNFDIGPVNGPPPPPLAK